METISWTMESDEPSNVNDLKEIEKYFMNLEGEEVVIKNRMTNDIGEYDDNPQKFDVKSVIKNLSIKGVTFNYLETKNGLEKSIFPKKIVYDIAKNELVFYVRNVENLVIIIQGKGIINIKFDNPEIEKLENVLLIKDIKRKVIAEVVLNNDVIEKLKSIL